MVETVDTIHVGIDMHAAHTGRAKLVVQFVGTAPKPPQKKPLHHVLSCFRQLRREYPRAAIHSCYEAGQWGFWLHRALVKEGINNVVVAPLVLNGRRKADRRDARQLCDLLDQRRLGDHHAFSVVAVPTPEEEMKGELLRHRKDLLKELAQLTHRGRKFALWQGCCLRGRWWGPRNWPEMKVALPAEALPLLEGDRAAALLMWERIQAADRAIAEMGRRQESAPPSGGSPPS